jgi:hypothetical protein
VPALAVGALQEVRRHEIDGRDADGGEGESVFGVVQHPRRNPNAKIGVPKTMVPSTAAPSVCSRPSVDLRAKRIAIATYMRKNAMRKGSVDSKSSARYERTPHMRPMSA